MGYAARGSCGKLSALQATEYEPLLKADLSCWRCGKGLKNMPALKAHLREEWEEEGRRLKAEAEAEAKMDES